MSSVLFPLNVEGSDHWGKATVGEVCRLINGRAYKKSELLDEGRYRVLRVGNFFTSNHWYFSDLELEDDKYCNDGDLLYAWSASFGPRIWSGNKTIYHYHIWKVEPDPAKVLRNYLFYFFEWDKELIRKEQGAGATMVHVSKGSMEARAIPLPPLDEQSRIVAILDQAFAALDHARALAEANLADAHALFQSHLKAAFDDCGEGRNRISFDRLCEVITPKVKIKRQDYLECGAHPIVSQEASLISGYWNDATALMELGEPVVIFGDHTCCLKYVDFDFVVGADGTKVLKPKTGVSAPYLYFGLRSQPVAESGYARHFKLLREKSLPEIPIAEQTLLADRLFGLEEKCEELARSYEAKLTDLDNLRQSLLQKAFSGQLT